MATLTHRSFAPFQPTGAPRGGAVLRPVQRTREDFLLDPVVSGTSSSSSSDAPSPRAAETLDSSRFKLLAPSPGVLGALGVRGRLLVSQLRHAIDVLGQGDGSDAVDVCRLLRLAARDVHCTLMEVDEDLMDSECAASVAAEGRRWVGSLQSYIMAMQRDLDVLVPDVPVSGASGASQRWTDFAKATEEKLQAFTAGMDAVAARPSEEAIVTIATTGCGQHVPQALQLAQHSAQYKLVVPRSRLPYKQHWACKVCV